MLPMGRPRHLCDIPWSAIFRATGENTHSRDPEIRNILDNSNREAPLSCFKKMKNMMDATVSRRLDHEHKPT